MRWLAVGLLSGDIDIDLLVPEGHDDLSGEGPNPVDFQVKSRQERVGKFEIRIVSTHILESSARRIARGAGTLGVIVLERGIRDTDIREGRTHVADLSEDHPLWDRYRRGRLQTGPRRGNRPTGAPAH